MSVILGNRMPKVEFSGSRIKSLSSTNRAAIVRSKSQLLFNVSPRVSSRVHLPLRPSSLVSCSSARPMQAFEVAGYLWLDVLEVDINVGYCKHLTVRISIKRQLRLQPLESEEG